MINLSVESAKEKIIHATGISIEELNSKIQNKMQELSGLISEVGAAHIIANELGVKLFSSNGAIKIKDIQQGMKNIEVLGKVTNIFDIREFNTGSRQGKVGNFIIADEASSIRVTVWNDLNDKLKNLQVGNIVKIKSGYVRQNQRGFKEIHLNDNSSIIINPPNVEIEVKQREKRKLSELSEGENVEVAAHIIDLYFPTFFEICPQCNKRARQNGEVFVCEGHGQVTPNMGYVVNLVLDDGSANVRTALFRNTADQLIPNIADFKQNVELFDVTKAQLTGVLVKIEGRVVRNQMNQNLEIIASSIKPETKPFEPKDSNVQPYEESIE